MDTVTTHSVTDTSNTFFAYKDYYVQGGERGAETDSEVTISLQ